MIAECSRTVSISSCFVCYQSFLSFVRIPWSDEVGVDVAFKVRCLLKEEERSLNTILFLTQKTQI